MEGERVGGGVVGKRREGSGVEGVKENEGKMGEGR